ncbi:hypothetical protein OIE66_18560 [Nonomuraea sp. NBC_01738]|uniref:hypothetical protein n=1 Tax=Nonomuraea sp. NBC_01738 TaxID=2976003 RepID=UPI002E12974D|nr:hypothetical protein OIE66_18560 [Nonomuraea sp. NBC_01738]
MTESGDAAGKLRNGFAADLSHCRPHGLQQVHLHVRMLSHELLGSLSSTSPSLWRARPLR